MHSLSSPFHFTSSLLGQSNKTIDSEQLHYLQSVKYEYSKRMCLPDFAYFYALYPMSQGYRYLRDCIRSVTHFLFYMQKLA